MNAEKQSYITYFYSPGACSYVPYVALCHAGIEVELVLAKVGAMTKEFLQINPKGRVPVIAMDNEVITEMAGVLTAVSSLAPECQILGKTTIDTIRVYEWLNYLSTVAHNQAMAQIWRTERFTNDVSTYPAIKARGHEVIQEVYGVIEEKLKSRGGKEFAVGDEFTVVDPFLVVVYLWSRRLGYELEDKYPVFVAYARHHLRKKAFQISTKLHEFVLV